MTDEPVSPHPKWEDDEYGLTNGSMIVTVWPVMARYSEDSSFVSTVARGQENAYAPVIRTDIDSPYNESSHMAVEFRYERPAWVFAHILTHYLHGKSSMDVETLLRDEPQTPEKHVWNPDHVIEDISPEEVFKKLLQPYPVPDAMDGVVSPIFKDE